MRGATAALLSLLALWVLLELSARVYLFGAAGLDPRRVDSVRPILETGYLRTSDEPLLGFELRPNVDGWFKLVRFRTNADGLRDRAYKREKPPGTFRVAVLGSSFTLPAGVAIEDAFHSLLEERFSAESPDRSYEFLNFAVGVYNPRQMLAMLRLRALAWDPDLILFCVTDFAAPIVLKGAWNTPPPEWDLRRRGHPVLGSFLVRLARLRLGMAEEPRSPVPRPLDETAPTVIEELDELSHTSGIPIVVTRLELDPRPPGRTDRLLARRSRRHGLHYFDTRASFAGAPPSTFWIYELDPHPNALAHRIFADGLATFLRAEGLLAPSAT